MINSMLPILIVGIVFGLAMDYEVFLVTRMREAYVLAGALEDQNRQRVAVIPSGP